MKNIKNITINIHQKNLSPLPIYLHTVSEYYQQGPLDRKKGCSFYQILAVIDGEGILNYGGKTYNLTKGNAFFIGPYTPISYSGSKNFITAFLTVKGEALPLLCKYFGCGNFLFRENTDIEKFRADISEITAEYYNEKRDSIISLLCYSFFIRFFEGNNEGTSLIRKISLYLEKNFSKKLTLKSIASVHNISVSKLCHDFKKEFNCSVFEYLINLRLSYARNYLAVNPEAKTKTVARLCGFDDASYFCKAYRSRYGSNPRSENY